MTDNDIIKALEIGREHLIGIVEDKEQGRWFLYKKDVLDPITRQKAEIESLERRLHNAQLHQKETYKALLKEQQLRRLAFGEDFIKAEAIKEFAERLRFEIVNTPFGVNCSGETDKYKEGCLRGIVAKQHNVLDMVDNLVKEMVGDV